MEKNDVPDTSVKSPIKKTISKHKEVELKPIEKRKPFAKKHLRHLFQLRDYADPLKVSPRLATFTLVSVLKPGLVFSSLDVLDALEKKVKVLNQLL